MKGLAGLIFLFAAAAPGWAQLQLFQFDGTTETAVANVYQVPQTSVGDQTITRFRVFNQGTAGAVLQTLSLAGQAFEISAAPSLPFTIAPGSFAEFKVLFAPTASGSYSANLLFNTTSVFVRGTAALSAVLSQGSNPLAAGATVDFGKLQFGGSTTQTFSLSNPGTSPVNIATIAVSGAGFQGPAGVSAPLTLNPGQIVSFTITFAPPAAQSYQGTLSIDQRSFNLTGLALSPPLPSATIEFSSQPQTSAQEIALSIALSGVSQVSGTGTLTMAFQPSVMAAADDAGVQFLSGPPRVATVTVAPGDSVGKFNGSSNIMFHTGTTAGTILFTLKMGSATIQKSITVSPAAVTFDTATGTAEAGSLIVSLIGFDNTYSASQLKFTFYNKSGQVMTPGGIVSDVTQSFKSYFATTTAGGSFALRASFLVTGDSSTVGGVDVAMTNSAGVATTQRITF